jgi:inhibitor of cysteine peptidase
MKIKSILMLIAIAVSMLLVACAVPAQPGSKARIEVSCEEFMNQKNISKQLEIASGSSFEVTLCSNPTTGFQWEEAQISNEAVLKQVDRQSISPESEPPPPPGTPGQEIWTFNAIQKGTSTVSIDYSRPWEGGEKGEWTFTLAVTVK